MCGAFLKKTNNTLLIIMFLFVEFKPLFRQLGSVEFMPFSVVLKTKLLIIYKKRLTNSGLYSNFFFFFFLSNSGMTV
ncbi:hypothetical protein Hdeb2414_s0044g00742021 [Helianthus debilis subsp. tardiflorus]